MKNSSYILSTLFYVVYYKFAKFELKTSLVHGETKKTNFVKSY
jgi:hypothetical protein